MIDTNIVDRTTVEGNRFDPARARGRGTTDLVRSFRTAAALGWKMEANWTDPLLFFIYSVAKPVASALILVFMLQVIAGPSGIALRPFVIVGSALWSFVVSGVAGLAWAVLDDRERYRMLKYIYVSPSSFLTILIGRGVARLAVGAMGAGITLAVGVVVLGVPFEPLAVNWPLLVIVLVMGVVTISALALVMAAICLQTRQESWDYPEVVVGALFLVVGAVFPLSVLPLPLQVFGLISPLTWWIAGVRQALFPGGPSSIGGPGSLWQQLSGQLNPSAVQVVIALLVSGAIVTLASAILFRAGEARAKDRGLIDRTTGS
ncbi:MAG TPA: ABC transporter permease [Candidatus Limnocylindrales bacterium]|nr:ABC transporter permease [Candidatus Limnocylindrales bacterium]